ncbi:alpha/beta hydrolase [Candidatus Woesearchaeota archaeon]|nr:alpha/beta hydrolase [Candidatus Woesearchaeota archaeon]
MEKVKFKNLRNKTLVGNLYTTNSKSIILMAHGFTGDKSGEGRFDKIAKSLNDIGYNILSFDFSGCGESDDDTLTVEKQVDDLNSDIKFVKSKGYQNIGLFGHSLGGLISLKCFTPEIVTMVLWAPVTNKIKYRWDKRYSKEQLQELEDKGYLTLIRDKGVRRKILIDKRMLAYRESIDQKDLLNNVNCPIMIIHGNKDESVPYTDSQDVIKLLSSDSELEIIDGANHGFYNHLDILIDLTKKWFIKHLKN